MARRVRWTRLLMIALAILGLTACSGGEIGGVPYGRPPMAGTWVGVINDSALGNGTLTLNTSQVECWYVVSCGWATRFETANYSLEFPSATYSGGVTGSWEGATMTLSLHGLCDDEASLVTRGTTDGRRVITTRYDNVTCLTGGASSGTLELSK